MAVETSQLGLIKSFRLLFYLSSINGLIPYSLSVYYTKKIFQVTILSNVWVVATTVYNIVQYHFSSFNFSLGDKADSGAGKLLCVNVNF